MPSDLLLRPLGPADEAEFAGAHLVLGAEGITFGHSYVPGMRWADYLHALEDRRLGIDLRPGAVASSSRSSTATTA